MIVRLDLLVLRSGVACGARLGSDEVRWGWRSGDLRATETIERLVENAPGKKDGTARRRIRKARNLATTMQTGDAGSGEGPLPESWLKDVPPREMALAQNIWDSMMKRMEEDGSYCDIFIHSNPFEPDGREGTDHKLFVSRSPYEVRRQEDTGLRIDFDEQTGRRAISLNDVEPDVFESGRISTSQDVCQACRRGFDYFGRYFARAKSYSEDNEVSGKDADRKTRHPELALPNCVIIHHNLYSLMAAAQLDNCMFCRRSLAFISQEWWGALQGSVNPLRYQIEMCWPQSRARDKEIEVWFVATIPSKPRRFSYTYFILCWMKLWPMPNFSHFFTPPQAEHPTDGPPVAPPSRLLARQWLSRCTLDPSSQHPLCTLPTSSHIPTRLLDVPHALSTSSLRLVLPASLPASELADVRWVTLSHCWGAWGAEHNPKLVASNANELLSTGLPLASLPKTFRDAVEVCAWFDVRYLWIDCLCIVQDSREDWLREARMMGRTYREAVLCISADVGEDSRAGLGLEEAGTDGEGDDGDGKGVGEEKAERMAWPRVEALGDDASAPLQVWTLTESGPEYFERIVRAPTFTRVWVGRERQVSRRILHFTGGEMVWECCGHGSTSCASERFPGGMPFELLFRENSKYQIGRLNMGLEEGDEATHATWDNACKWFMRQNLTRETDRPIVMSSLAEEFQAFLPDDEYIAGMWRSRLPYALLWHTLQYRAGEAVNEPSWSWLSAGVPVKLPPKPAEAQHVVLTEVLDISLNLATEDAYGPLQSGAIELRGCLRKICIEPQPQDMAYHMSVFDENWRSLGLPCHYRGGDVRLELDSELKSPTLTCFALIVYARLSPDKERLGTLMTLLLRPMSGENTFTRIGRMEILRTHALKLRYSLKSPAEVEEETAWELVEQHIYGNDGGDGHLDESQDGKDSIDGGRHVSEDQVHEVLDRPAGFEELYASDNLPSKRYPWLKELDPTSIIIK